MHFCPELYSESDSKFLLSQSNSLLEVSITEYAKQYDFKKLLQLKEELLVYIVGMKELGLIKNDGLINVLIQHNETYLNQLFDEISNKVLEFCSNESFVEIEVKDEKDLQRFVEYYGIELNQEITEFPNFLPFSLMVKDINDIVKATVDDIYSYCKNLFNDETDFVLFYGSIDKLLCKIIGVLEKHFVYDTKLTILQIAIICNNIEHLKRSIMFYQSCAYKHSKNNSAFEFNYTATAQFNQLKSR